MQQWDPLRMVKKEASPQPRIWIDLQDISVKKSKGQNNVYIAFFVEMKSVQMCVCLSAGYFGRVRKDLVTVVASREGNRVVKGWEQKAGLLVLIIFYLLLSFVSYMYYLPKYICIQLCVYFFLKVGHLVLENYISFSF